MQIVIERYDCMSDNLIQRQNALYRIINYEYENHEEFKALSRMIDLDKDIKKSVIRMEFYPLLKHASSLENQEIINIRLNEYIEKVLFGRKIYIISVMQSSNQLVVVIDYDFVDLIIEAMTEIAGELKYDYKIGIGSPFVMPKYMSTSLREAHDAMMQHGCEKNINIYLPVTDGNMEYYNLYTEFNNKIIMLLETGKFDSIPEMVNAFFNDMRSFELEVAFNCCINSIIHILDFFGIDRIRQFRIKYRFDLIDSTSQEGINGIQATYFDNIVAIIDLVKDMKENSTKYAINEIQNIVSNEYSDPDLSLYVISARLNFSYCYLSKVFKKIMGIGFVEYLISVRMENAKKLLYDERIKIYEIAKLVGYRSSNYFVTTFYKYYNMSTTEYRERIEKQAP
jgi:YesN/AraC family two-component response regulator